MLWQSIENSEVSRPSISWDGVLLSSVGSHAGVSYTPLAKTKPKPEAKPKHCDEIHYPMLSHRTCSVAANDGSQADEDGDGHMQLQEVLAFNVAHQAPRVLLVPPGLPAPDANADAYPAPDCICDEYKLGELCSQTLVRVQHMELYCYYMQFPENKVPIILAETHGAKLWWAVVDPLKKFVEKGGATMKQVKQLKEQLIEGATMKQVKQLKEQHHGSLQQMFTAADVQDYKATLVSLGLDPEPKEQLIEGSQVTSCVTLEEIDVDEGTKADEADALSPVPDADGCIEEADNYMKYTLTTKPEASDGDAVLVKEGAGTGDSDDEDEGFDCEVMQMIHGGWTVLQPSKVK